jgi:hypothetical protein
LTPVRALAVSDATRSMIATPRLICHVHALLLGLLSSAAVARAAYVSPSHEAAAQQLISNLELHERFLEERERYLQFMGGRGLSPPIVKHIGDQLKLTNVMSHMTGFIAAQFSEAELAPINAYLESEVGRKEYQLVLALVKERREAPPGTFDANTRIAAFKESLAPPDRAATEAFRGSPAGQKYWSALGAIDKKLNEVFAQRRDDILQKLAATVPKAGEAKEPKAAADKTP